MVAWRSWGPRVTVSGEVAGDVREVGGDDEKYQMLISPLSERNGGISYPDWPWTQRVALLPSEKFNKGITWYHHFLGRR